MTAAAIDRRPHRDGIRQLPDDHLGAYPAALTSHLRGGIASEVLADCAPDGLGDCDVLFGSAEQKVALELGIQAYGLDR